MLANEIEDGPRTNWSGNYEYNARRLHFPQSKDEVRQVVASCKSLKVLGARHSFNSIADSATDQISLKHLDQMSLDPKAQTVTVGGGVTYGKVAPHLYERGYALHNLASLPHVSVVGACTTATHGSGVKNGNLSTAVTAFEMITGDGKVVSVSRKDDAEYFPGAVVALGALGVVTSITLNVEPAFDFSQVVYENLSFNQLEQNLEEIFSTGYSVSLFTDWQNHQAAQLWVKRRVEPNTAFNFPNEYFGAKLATRNLHPLAGDRSAGNCSEQMGIPGPWHERLPHFRMNFTPSSGAELQSEYFVPCERGYEAILAIEQLKDRLAPHLFVAELRRIQADDLWLSPCYKRDSMGLHFTWKPDWPAVKNLLPLIEEKLAPFQPRPHWAKLFTMPAPQLQACYKKLPAYKELVAHHDPSCKFRNEFLRSNLYAAS